MRLVQSTYDTNDDILHITPMSCFHVGHVNCDYELIQKTINSLSHNNRGLLLGDLAEIATKHSIGKGLFDTSLTPRDQREKLIEILRPKAQFIDGAVVGNHEMRLVNDTSIDIVEDVCTILGIPYLGFRGIVKYTFNKRCYTVMLWHGAGKGATAQTAIKTVENMSHKTFADVYCCGHFHKNITSDRFFTLPDTRNMKLTKVQQHFVCVGSALKADESYADEKDLEERILGFPTIHLFSNTPNKYIEVTK